LALGLTYSFDAAPCGDPYPVEVRFVGRRIGSAGEAGPGDSFTTSEMIERVIPGSGRIAITARVTDVAPGEWTATARLFTGHRRSGSAGRASPSGSDRQRAFASGRPGFGPVIFARAPGAHLGAWPALVAAGVGVAVTVQAILAGRAHLPVSATIWVSFIASVVGLLGAKVYYLAEQRPRTRLRPRALLTAGMCIQGFVLTAIGTAIIGSVVSGIAVGRFLDVTAPGLLFGMTIGRFGCFFGGCCAGRPTGSRWGLWSSDRRVGVRRIPTQLLESGVAGVIGVTALLTVLRGSAVPPGAVFVGAIAAYTFGRQLLLPWRDLPRKTARVRPLVAAVALTVLLVDMVIALL
jgi:phosphatidylglycerol:prolipoprotein diacylglycerol transferase